MQLGCNCAFWNMYVAICPKFIVFILMLEPLKLWMIWRKLLMEEMM